MTTSTWRPAAEPLDPVVLVHRDSGDVVTYWCGDTNSWTAARVEAMTFQTFNAANLERNRARRMHPGMRMELERMP